MPGSADVASRVRQMGIEGYLAEHEHKSMLRFITCGSVDDGKSTLIGRLLFESQLILDDQMATLAADSRKVGTQGDEIDFALLVDGLAAEREQGITIDVAYRFFTTDTRKFIVADTPGHEQYTRNMVTGASTADLAVILVDGRKGILPQTRRHSFLVSLMGIRQVLVAVNKLDLLDFDEATFRAIEADYLALAEALGIEDVRCIPLSALRGDNLTSRSDRTPWYDGPDLLACLEQAEPDDRARRGPFRMPVQWVSRPSADFRGFAGTVVGGTVHPGDRVKVLPSGVESTVARLVTADGDLDEAEAGQSVTVTLADEVDVSQGVSMPALLLAGLAPGLYLAGAGCGKLIGHSPGWERSPAGRWLAGLGLMTSRGWRRSIGMFEAGLGIALMTSWASVPVGALALAWLGGCSGYQAWMLRTRPGSSCGCSRRVKAVSKYSLLRTGVLIGCILNVVLLPMSVATTVPLVAMVGVFLLESLVLYALSWLDGQKFSLADASVSGIEMLRGLCFAWQAPRIARHVKLRSGAIEFQRCRRSDDHPLLHGRARLRGRLRLSLRRWIDEVPLGPGVTLLVVVERRQTTITCGYLVVEENQTGAWTVVKAERWECAAKDPTRWKQAPLASVVAPTIKTLNPVALDTI